MGFDLERHERARLGRMLEDERKQRLTLRCQCGVRLDVVRVEAVRGGDPRLITNSFQQGREQDIRAELGGPRPVKRKVARHFTWDSPTGTAVNYRCRSCGVHHAANRERLLHAVEKRLKAGGKDLVLGLDL